MKKQTGLTLIELTIVVVIVGIMASIAVPNFGSLMRNSQMKTAYNDFVGTIATARSEAINQSTTITACVSTDQSSCVTTGNGTWSDGYIIFIDRDQNRARDTTATSDEDVLAYREPVGLGIRIESAEYPIAIAIPSRGRIQQPGTFVFCDGENSETARAFNLLVTGIGRLATDGSDTDNIVEGINGNVDCSTSSGP